MIRRPYVSAAVGMGLLLLALMSGCSSATPTTRYYLLSDPGALDVAADSSCSIRLGAVNIAPYLHRTHIMLQSGTNELVPALQHRWSEPLEAGVGRLLSSCLGGGQSASHRASVQIAHLHGSTDGSVVLQAEWSLTAEGAAEEVSAGSDGRFSQRLPQGEAGYDSLVSTQRALVLELCGEIRKRVGGCE